MSNERNYDAEYQDPQDGVQHETGDPYTDPMQDTEDGPKGGAGTPGDAGAPGDAGERASEQELKDELGHVARQVRELMQAAWRSEQRQQIQAEVKRGIHSIATSLEEGFQRVSKSEQTKESVNKARDTAESMGERVRSSQAGQELADGLLRSLRTISQQLNKLADELEPAKKESDATDSARSNVNDPQDIPVDRDDL